ncbi:MAG: carbohydrate ABC transporter permease [Chloroflexi bacterium]|nr:carbohydrate ABC transporter permease [Chloroflexota bacterium]
MNTIRQPIGTVSRPIDISLNSRSLTWRRLVFGLIFCAFTFLWMLPAIWSLVTSLRYETDIQRDLIGIVPFPLTTVHYERILGDGLVVRWFLNSLVVASTRTVIQLTLCSLAAFAFTRIPFKGKRLLYILVLIGITVPFEAILIPIYLFFADLRLHNTYAALIAPEIASPLALFLLTQFFQEIPTELDEAAYLDGASRLTVYLRVILPLASPVLTTLAIFTFLGTWNEYLWPLVSATDRQALTITIGLRKLAETFGHQTRDLGLKMAGAWVGGIPILIFYFIFQRRIVSGIKLTSGFR